MKRVLIALAVAWAVPAAAEVDYAAQLKEGDAILRDFTFAGPAQIRTVLASTHPRLKWLSWASAPMPR